MRRSDKEIIDPQVLEEILKKNHLCRIALCDGDVPYVLPMNYGYSNKKLYIHSATEGRKLDIIRKNNRVCFEITDHKAIIKGELACDYGTRYRCLIGYGRINILEERQEKIDALNSIMFQHTKKDGWDYLDDELAKMVVLEITVESLSGKKSHL